LPTIFIVQNLTYTFVFLVCAIMPLAPKCGIELLRASIVVWKIDKSSHPVREKHYA
jgi:hypothetical protein